MLAVFAQLSYSVRLAAREPLTHFLVVGFALTVAAHIYQRQHDLFHIEVTQARVAHLAEAYQMQYGERPGPQQLETLIQGDIEDEMLFREGMALKLDQDDEIVRRRIVQKMKFLADDMSAPAEAKDGQIEAYYAAHAEKYMLPPDASFTHVFFSADSAGAQARAGKVLALLHASNAPRAPTLGDPFPDLYDFAHFGRFQVERLFGQTAFADAVFSAPVGIWAGPFRSGYGWHLLRVNTRTAGLPMPLAAVRAQVCADLLAAARDQRNRAQELALRRRFTITRSDTAL